MKPQLYVEMGMQLAVVEERVSKILKNTTFTGLNFGGEKFGHMTTMFPSNAGDLVFLTQRSMLPAKKTYDHDVMFKPVLGIYKEHCQNDILEADALIKMAEERVQPKRIDYRALFACFGNETFFSVMKDHLRILDQIRTQISLMKFEETEDLDETPTYNPNLRRLAFILLQKTHCEENADGQLELSSLLT